MIISRALLPVSPHTKTTLSKSYAPHNISVPTKFGTAHNADSGWNKPQLNYLKKLDKSLTNLIHQYKKPLLQALSHNPKNDADLTVIRDFIKAWNKWDSAYGKKFPENDTLEEIRHSANGRLRGIVAYCDAFADSEDPNSPGLQELLKGGLPTIRPGFDLAESRLGVIHNLFHTKHVPLSETLKFVESNNETTLNKKQIHLQFSINIPDEMLQQFTPSGMTPLQHFLVLDTLLDNAIQYSNKPKSKIELTIEFNDSFDQVTITIKDYGIGIPSQNLNQVGRIKYRRGDNAKKIPGSGYGLFTAIRLIEAAGGKFEIESTENEGTTVSYTLPIEEYKPQRNWFLFRIFRQIAIYCHFKV